MPQIKKGGLVFCSAIYGESTKTIADEHAIKEMPHQYPDDKNGLPMESRPEVRFPAW